jgi:hypothetical protein
LLLGTLHFVGSVLEQLGDHDEQRVGLCDDRAIHARRQFIHLLAQTPLPGESS